MQAASFGQPCSRCAVSASAIASHHAQLLKNQPPATNVRGSAVRRRHPSTRRRSSHAHAAAARATRRSVTAALGQHCRRCWPAARGAAGSSGCACSCVPDTQADSIIGSRIATTIWWYRTSLTHTCSPWPAPAGDAGLGREATRRRRGASVSQWDGMPATAQPIMWCTAQSGTVLPPAAAHLRPAGAFPALL